MNKLALGGQLVVLIIGGHKKQIKNRSTIDTETNYNLESARLVTLLRENIGALEILKTRRRMDTFIVPSTKVPVQ